VRKFWLELAGPPGRQFATNRSLAPYLDTRLSVQNNLIEVGNLRSSAAATGSDQNINIDVTLDNTSLICTKYFINGVSPHGQTGNLYQVDEKGNVRSIFEGRVYNVQFTDLKCVLSLQV
jgi:hypothetical protein